MSIFNVIRDSKAVHRMLGEKMYYKITYDGTPCIIEQRDLVDMLPEDRSEWKDYAIEAVWMNLEKFESLPDF